MTPAPPVSCLASCDEILRLVVDRVVGAELEARVALVVAAGRDDDLRAQGLGHLDGRDADAAGAALDQQRLAGLQAGAVEDVAPHREESLRQRRRFDIAHALGNRQALAHRRHAQLRVAATGHQRADAVALLEPGRGHGRAVALDDLAGHFQARDIRGAGRHRVVAGALQHVRAVDAAGGDTDQEFTRARDGRRPFAQTQDVGLAKGADFDGFHRGRGPGCPRGQPRP